MAEISNFTADELRKYIKTSDMKNVKVGVFDIDGILRGKYMHRDKFLSALDKGFGFCDVVLGWDSNDQLYDSATFTGWHTAYPDADVRLLPETAREIPFEENTLMVLGEFAGDAESVCPRGTLRRVLARAKDMGFTVHGALEYEFFLFDETPHSVREKGYRNLTPITPGFFGYSVLRNSVESDFYHDLLNLCAIMRFPLEGLHTETGPGVLEAAINISEGVEIADRGALFKTFTKVLAQRQNRMATFMAKWSPDWPGQSGHIHMSLRGKNGESIFYDESKPDAISDNMRWFLGGQQALMPELLSMIACTVNSYSRLIPGFWAPTHATWGIDNRTCALRAITGGEKRQHIEYRIAAADVNAHIGLAAVVGSGLWGIENKIEPTDPVKGNAYEQKFPKKLDFPATLFEAAGLLRTSKPARDLSGDAFVEHYAQSREWEEREFRKSITDWEMERYFEII
jgi:glutamine synthetase